MNARSRTGNIFENVAIKAPVRVGTTESITLSDLQTIDGELLVAGDRVLVKDQADPTLNGIYQAEEGIWARTTDAHANTDFIEGTLVLLAQGSQAGILFVCTCDDSPIVIGSSDLTFRSQSDVLTAMQSATSATSESVTLGGKVFEIQAGKDFAPGEYVIIFRTSDRDNRMLAKIAAYGGDMLAVNVVALEGAGTFDDWSIVLTNTPAAAGIVPPIGGGNVNGPGVSVAGHVATFTDASGLLLSDSGRVLGGLAARDTLLYGDAGAASIPESALAPGASPLPFVAVQTADNLQLKNDISNPSRDVTATAGRVRDDTDIVNLHLAAAMVKRLDQAWVAGGTAIAPVGGCDTGVKGANQTWHQYLIAKLGLVITGYSRTSNVVTVDVAGHGLGVGGSFRIVGAGGGVDCDAVISAVTTDSLSFANVGADTVGSVAVTAVGVGFDLLASQSYPTPASMPAGWTAKQCLGSFLTNGAGNIIPVTQLGDLFFFTTAIPDITTLSTTSSLATVTVPKDVRVEAHFNVLINSPISGGGVNVTPPGVIAPNTKTAHLIINGSGGVNVLGAQVRCLTNTSGQVQVTNDTGCNITAATLGYRDPRRRMF